MVELSALTPASASPVLRLDDPRLEAVGVELWLKRDDLLHPEIPGNKWRKLRRNLAALPPGTPILTFGGAYSNHLRAVAAAGAALDIETIGVVRGGPYPELNWSLARAAADGMRLSYLDRATYRRKHTDEVLGRLRERFGDVAVIPEGGSNALGVRGAADLAAELTGQLDVDLVCVPCGSGGTLAGVAAGLRPRQQAWGFAVLKGGGFLNDVVAELQSAGYGRRVGGWRIIEEFHHGGFARSGAVLEEFSADFTARHDIVLESIYVAKMMHGIFTMARRGDIAAGTRVAAVLTGPAAGP